MRRWDLDRDAIILRNQRMARAFHSQSTRHQLRRYLLNSVASFPFMPLFSRTRRVLFIRPDHIGDMLLATPAMVALKQAQPNTEIHVLAGAWSASVLANIPEIDRVLTIDFPGFNRNAIKTSFTAPYEYLVKVSRQLRQIGYTSAVILRPDHWWGAMLAHVAGIRERVGYALPDVAPFLTRALPFQPQHAIRQNLQLVEAWTGKIEDSQVPYHFPIWNNDAENVSEFLRQYHINPQTRLICIHAGAGTWVKQWEAGKWAKVADTLADQLDAEVIFTGTEGERSLVDSIQNATQRKTYNAVGAFNLGQLAALFAQALVVLAPDSGPLHLAAAVGTPTVALFGPADPLEFAPWGDKRHHLVLSLPLACRPCRVLDWADDDPAYHPCVRDISVADVLEAARRVTSPL